MREILLSGGRDGVAIVDDADFDRCAPFAWHIGAKGYVQTTQRSVTTQLHRFILGAAANEMVDHVNGNARDNVRTNLRRCTNRQNCWNRKGRSNRTTPYKGILRSGKRWSARINVGHGDQHLGTFDTPEQAARAYDDAARRHFGDFARVNFPNEGEQAA